MNRKDLEEYIKTIRHYVSARRLNAAITTLGQLLDLTAASWQQRQELEQVRSDYSYLCLYALDGADDPQREQQYARLSGRILDLLLQARRSAMTVDSPTLYYSTLRYEKLQQADTIPSLLAQYRHACGILEMARLSGSASDALTQKVQEVEKIEKRIFDRLWTTLPLSADDETAITALLHDDETDPTLRSLLMSALTLSLLTGGYDERALYILLLAYHIDSDHLIVRMRALIGWLLAMDRYRDRALSARAQALLATVAESADWATDVRAAFMQFIRTRDTEKISRTVTDEVLPTMMKLRPDIYKKINENPESILDPEAMQENPEWEEMLEKSGIADKMRQLQEMQEEGADVMMSAFAHLKSYPFFNDVAAWFLPYRSWHSAIDPAGESAVARMLQDQDLLCDSDRYSVALTLGRMPQSQRSMLETQLTANAEMLQQQRDAELTTPAAEREAHSRRYVHNLYRFFRLFRRKSEFDDPFVSPSNLATVPALAPIFDTPDQLLLIAQFYFSRAYYDEALALMRRAEALGHPSLELLQKMGYSLQRLGKTDDALAYYLKAEMLDGANRWTRRRIAACYRILGRPADALRYYLPLTEELPDDLTLALHTGHCYLESGDYKGALGLYFKVEFLEGGRGRAIRPIAWCSFLSADYTRAADYYQRIPAAELNATDHLNIGHLHMATGAYRDAVDAYRKAIEAMDSDRARFVKAMQADLRYLRDAGVSDLMTGIVLDTLLA